MIVNILRVNNQSSFLCRAASLWLLNPLRRVFHWRLWFVLLLSSSHANSWWLVFIFHLFITLWGNVSKLRNFFSGSFKQASLRSIVRLVLKNIRNNVFFSILDVDCTKLLGNILNFFLRFIDSLQVRELDFKVSFSSVCLLTLAWWFDLLQSAEDYTLLLATFRFQVWHATKILRKSLHSFVFLQEWLVSFQSLLLFLRDEVFLEVPVTWVEMPEHRKHPRKVGCTVVEVTKELLHLLTHLGMLKVGLDYSKKLLSKFLLRHHI